MSLEIIKGIIEQILSIALPEGIAKVSEMAEQRRKRDTLQDSIRRILESAQSNDYYNDLTRLLLDTRILQDCFSSYATGNPTQNVEVRISDALKHFHIDGHSAVCITGVFQQILHCMDSVILQPASAEEARNAYRQHQILQTTQDTLTGVNDIRADLSDLKKALSVPQPAPMDQLTVQSILAYGESVPDTANMIPRKLMPFSENGNEAISVDFINALQQSHIVIVNDAGLGKTIALRQFFYEATACGYSCVYLSLNRYPGIPLFHRLETNQPIDSGNIVLFMDGYDEVKADDLPSLTIALNTIAAKHRGIRLVVSSRTNGYIQHPLGPDGFEKYNLARITPEERDAYLGKLNIDAIEFSRQIRDNGLSDMIESVFNFIELVHLWQADGSLPNEAVAMDRIIERRLQADRHKYEKVAPALTVNEVAIRHALERIAFIMQCTHSISIKPAQLQQICDADVCKQIGFHGIWEENADGNLCFIHNNYREYLAACWLNRLSINEIVGFISWPGNAPAVRPSWMNVVAYLAKKRTARDLRDWIAEHDPCIITLFEKQLFSESERLEIFERIYKIHETNQTWANIDYYQRKKMGAFSSSSNAVAYILDKLSKYTHMRQVKNLLRILAHFDELYEHVDDCRMIIGDIAFDVSLPTHVRNDAIDVMRAFPQHFSDFVDKAAEHCLASEDSLHRYHLYSFIDKLGKLDEYFAVIINELKQPKKDDDTIDITGSLFLDDLFKRIQSPDSLVKLFELVIENPDCIDEDPFKKAWNDLLQVAIHHHKTHSNAITPIVLKLFCVAEHRFCMQLINSIKQYMIATNTEEAFLTYIIGDDDVRDVYAVESLLCPSFTSVLIEYYNADKLPESKLLENVLARLSPDNDACSALARAIFAKTHIMPSLPVKSDYAALTRIGHQRLFDSLSSREQFSLLVNELCEILGEDTPVGDAYYVKCDAVDQATTLRECLAMLHNVVGDDESITLNQVVGCIKNWDWFRYCKTSNMLGAHKDIVISADQKSWMEQYTAKKLEALDVDALVQLWTAESCFNQTIHIALITMHRLRMLYPEEFFRSLLRLPSFYFGESDPTAFPQYLLDCIPSPVFREQVLHNIYHEELCSDVASAHLRYCTERKLVGAKEFAIAYLKRNDSGNIRYVALNYLSDMYGIDVLINDVLPMCTDAEFLKDITYHIPSSQPVTELENMLADTYEKEHTREWQEILIKRNHRTALIQYYEEAKSAHSIPDMTHGSLVPSLTDSISYITDPRLVDVIIQLLRLCNTPNFVDKGSFGLRHSCWESIKRMAAVDYKTVRDALVSEREAVDEEAQKLTCIDLIQRIEEMYAARVDNALTFEEALVLTSG